MLGVFDGAPTYRRALSQSVKALAQLLVSLVPTVAAADGVVVRPASAAARTAAGQGRVCERTTPGGCERLLHPGLATRRYGTARTQAPAAR